MGVAQCGVAVCIHLGVWRSVGLLCVYTCGCGAVWGCCVYTLVGVAQCGVAVCIHLWVWLSMGLLCVYTCGCGTVWWLW